MIYGMYLSATGIITQSHQQDVIANNIANSETAGFKRQLVRMQEAEIEAMVKRQSSDFNPPFDNIGGGQKLMPSHIDLSQGALDPSANHFDTAIAGNGFIAVKEGDQTHLTRNGQLMLDRDGNLINTAGHTVLDSNRQPIVLRDRTQNDLKIDEKGNIRDETNQVLATIGLFDVADPSTLRPVAGTMLAPEDDSALIPATGVLRSGFTEGSNVDPATEITRLMETQRLLEANANMIKYQDQSVGRLITEVGKIS